MVEVRPNLPPSTERADAVRRVLREKFEASLGIGGEAEDGERLAGGGGEAVRGGTPRGGGGGGLERLSEKPDALQLADAPAAEDAGESEGGSEGRGGARQGARVATAGREGEAQGDGASAEKVSPLKMSMARGFGAGGFIGESFQQFGSPDALPSTLPT